MAKDKWTDDETSRLLVFWLEHLEDYKRHKTPFYEAAAEEIGTKQPKSVKNRCEHLDRKYQALKAKVNASFSGGREKNGPAHRAAILAELKWYYELDDILRTFVSIRPRPYMIDTTTWVPTGQDKRNDLQTVPSEQAQSARLPPPSDTPQVSESPAAAAPAVDAQVDTPRSENGAGNSPTRQESPLSNDNPNKRKAYEPSIANILLQLGERTLELERSRLDLKHKQFEFEMLARREEMAFRREEAEQRRREFELMYQAAQAQYELDKMKLEAKLSKISRRE